MNFAFSEEQDEYRDLLRRFVEERWPVAETRRLAETDAGFDRAVWEQMADELGLQGLAVAEAHGGEHDNGDEEPNWRHEGTRVGRRSDKPTRRRHRDGRRGPPHRPVRQITAWSLRS